MGGFLIRLSITVTQKDLDPQSALTSRECLQHTGKSQDSTAGEGAQEMSPHRMKNGVHHVKIMPLSELGLVLGF